MGTAAPRVPVTACIALGANLGDARRTVEAAMDDIGGLPGTQLHARSSLYRSAPVDSSGPEYINAVVLVQTRLAPGELLAALQALEAAAGRERPWRNAPRTLDLDILLYGDERIDSQTLTVPHPRMFERAFVLVPLAEIAPEKVTPAQLAAVARQEVFRL
ncbi:MAG: 2-amino-4-hydroxy-6-hydroxymethyldihydropteridine diphosphokinase [Haliea sp.]|nr:MAG: 2-amino-4-hydroxy-6-hydroxymethyldihydropteridine diphosphokinase [Haliea sp.]